MESVESAELVAWYTPMWTLTLLGTLDSLKSARLVVNTNEDLGFDNLNIDTQFDISSAPLFSSFLQIYEINTKILEIIQIFMSLVNEMRFSQQWLGRVLFSAI